MSEQAAKRFVFQKKALSSPSDAAMALKSFSEELVGTSKISLDMSEVEELSDAYADSFFGNIAADLVASGVAMSFEFKDGLGMEFSAKIRAAINKALPPSLGGSATVH